jgi:hypothetical protein
MSQINDVKGRIGEIQLRMKQNERSRYSVSTVLIDLRFYGGALYVLSTVAPDHAPIYVLRATNGEVQRVIELEHGNKYMFTFTIGKNENIYFTDKLTGCVSVAHKVSKTN